MSLRHCHTFTIEIIEMSAQIDSPGRVSREAGHTKRWEDDYARFVVRQQQMIL